MDGALKTRIALVLRPPLPLVYLAAAISEIVSSVFKTRSPLTKDFIDIGRVPYHGDTYRFRAELLPSLKYPNIKAGVQEMIV